MKATPSMLVAATALFVSLGGAAAAGTGLITGSQIANHTIGTAKLTPTALTYLKTPGASTGRFDQALGPLVTQCAFGGGSCQVASSTASCPTGVAVGGGYVTGSVNNIVASARVAGASSYTVVANNNFDTPSWVQAYVVCEQGMYGSIIVSP